MTVLALVSVVVMLTSEPRFLTSVHASKRKTYISFVVFQSTDLQSDICPERNSPTFHLIQRGMLIIKDA